jgi:pantothenate synthetase
VCVWGGGDVACVRERACVVVRGASGLALSYVASSRTRGVVEQSRRIAAGVTASMIG